MNINLGILLKYDILVFFFFLFFAITPDARNEMEIKKILINYLIHVTRAKFLIGQFSFFDRFLEVKNTQY